MVYAGVPLLVVLVLWPHHPHRRSPRLPPHLHNYPTSEVQTVVIVVVVVIVIVVVIVDVVVVPESLSHLSASPPNQTVHTTESEHLKGHSAPRVSNVTLLHQGLRGTM